MSSGGGGGGATTTSGIAPEFKPQLTRAVNLATENLEREIADPNAVVASSVPLQEGVAASRMVANQALQGIDPTAGQRALENVAGQQMYNQQGSLGSARAMKAREAALADAAVGLQQQNLNMQAQGAQGLTQAGQLARQVNQEQLNAPHTALQRYFGYLGNVGQQQQSSQSGGGGK